MRSLTIVCEIDDRAAKGKFSQSRNAYFALAMRAKPSSFMRNIWRLIVKSVTGVAKGQISATWEFAYKNLGELRKAIEFCEEQLFIVRENRRRARSNALGNLGIA